MSDDGAPSNSSNGAAALRETTKWLVGGVVITAAGVFAGSSLTNLGSLDPNKDAVRLALALVGAVTGFVALGLIMNRAIAVLTVESLSLRMIAAAESDKAADPRLKGLAAKLWSKFHLSSPLTAHSLSEFSDMLEGLGEADPLFAKAEAFASHLIPDASFLYVRDHFARLVRMLIPATALAVAGFGLFAWAANPAAPPAAGTSNAAVAR